jgi:PAT family beta-lactamase induction signal transducer AmpG
MLLMSFSSGLPIALVLSTLQMWYTVNNIGLATIGFLTLIGLPYTYKFLWSPLMDRFVPPFLGRRRGWMLITQVLLLVGIFFMALLNPKEQPTQLALLAVCVALFSASQDIVLDAYRTDVLTADERGLGLALWANGYRIGMIVSGAVALIIANDVGWRAMYISMALLMLIGVLASFWADEPKVCGKISQNFRATLIEPFRAFLKKRYAILLLLVVIFYKIGDAFSLSLASPFFYRELHFNLTQIAWVFKVFGTVASVCGTLLAGVLMTRLNLYKSLIIFGWLQAIALLFFSALAIVGNNFHLFAASVFIENFTSGMGTVALLALLTALCDRRYSATHYAFLSAFMAIGRTFIGPVAGFTIQYIDWATFFAIACLLGLSSLVILSWLNIRLDLNQEYIV